MVWGILFNGGEALYQPWHDLVKGYEDQLQTRWEAATATQDCGLCGNAVEVTRCELCGIPLCAECVLRDRHGFDHSEDKGGLMMTTEIVEVFRGPHSYGWLVWDVDLTLPRSGLLWSREEAEAFQAWDLADPLKYPTMEARDRAWVFSVEGVLV